MHALSARAASVRRNHRAVFFFVEFDAERVEPLDRFGRTGDEFVHEFLFCVEVTAAESVEKMPFRRIVRFVGRLNAAFGHHRVRISDAEFCDEKHFCARVVRFYRRRRSRTTSSDNEYVGFVIGFRQIDFFRFYARHAL